MKHTVVATIQQTQANALLADIHAVPTIAIPRRETIVAWLTSYLDRSSAPGYGMAVEDSDDLLAVDQFLRDNGVPVAVQAAA